MNILVLLIIIPKILFVFCVAYLFYVRPKKYLTLGILLSYLYGITSWTFIYATYPLNSFNPYSSFVSDISILTFLILSVSIISGLYSLTLLIKNKHSTFSPLYFAVVFTLSEIAVAIIQSIVLSKYPSLGGLDFAFTNTGYALATTPYVVLSYFGHVYILTFLLALFVALIIKIYLAKKYKALTIFLIFVILFGFVLHFTDRKPTIIDTSKIMILPEDERYLEKNSTKSIPKNIDLVVDGQTIHEDGKMFNVSIFYDVTNNTKIYQYKRFLMPFGEYMPYLFNFLEVFAPNFTNTIHSRHTYSSIEETNLNNEPFIYDGKYKIFTALCSDAWSPVSLFKIRQSHPDLLILQRREVMFHKNPYYIANTELWKEVLGHFMRVQIIDIIRE